MDARVACVWVCRAPMNHVPLEEENISPPQLNLLPPSSPRRDTKACATLQRSNHAEFLPPRNGSNLPGRAVQVM